MGSSVRADLTATLEQLRTPETLFLGVVEEKEKHLKDMRQQREKLLKEKNEFDIKTNSLVEELKGNVVYAQQQIEHNPEDEYAKQRLTLLNETYQTVKELQRAHEQRITMLNNLIKLDTIYIEDPAFTAYQKERKLVARLYYSFEDIQKLHELIVDQEKNVEQLNEQRRNSLVEFENRTRVLSATNDEYRRRQEELEQVNRPISMFRGKKYDAQQTADMLSLEQQWYDYRLQLDQIRVELATYDADVITTKMLIAEGHLKILKNYARTVKSAVRVSESDVEQAVEELDKKKQAYFSAKELNNREVERVIELRKKKEQELDTVSASFGVPIGIDLDEWTRDIKKTADDYRNFVHVSLLNTQLHALRYQQEFLEAQAILEDEKARYDAMQVFAKKTYHKIVVNKLITEDDTSREIKQYDSYKNEAKAHLTRAKDRVIIIPELLNHLKKIVENIERLAYKVREQKERTFARRLNDYEYVMQMIEAARAQVLKSIDLLSKLTSTYSGITASATSTIRLVDFMVGQLRSITFWYRPDYAISWQGISNIVPDIMTFFSYVRSYMTRLHVNTLVSRIITFLSQPINILLILLIKIIAVAGTLLLFRRCSLLLIPLLMYKVDRMTGFMRSLILLVLAFLQFTIAHFWGLFIWFLLFAVLLMQAIPELAFYLFFYLLSIPYLLYLAHSFIKFFIHFNVRYRYVFLAEDFQRRFVAVFSFFAYASIVIVFFREAFMLVNYYGSALPTILLAVNFIIFQISLILLISREQIVHLIPQRSVFWGWVREQIDHYFYHLQFLVIAIIVMSNPYVGYGRLVLYSFFGLVYTGLLIAILLWLHGFFKRITSRVFFMTDDEVVRERFANAKMWFGLFIITSFLVFVFLGFVIAAKIWGRPISYLDMRHWFMQPLIDGQPISLQTILYLIFFVFAGFAVSHALNRYVLDKIFDLLLVDAGVQHTVTSITAYIIFIIALFLGLQSIGLGNLVGWAFAALTLSLGWVLKEPVSDFVAYFVILVQRPIKIGDYIRIDNDTMGIVRRISVRSVVLRRRNSTTIIVPNSFVISHTVTNWNYVRGFIAFDDIILTIDYREDPILVRDILVSIVESHPNILRTPRPIVRLDNFGDHGFVFLVRGYMSSSYTLDQWDIASDIRLAIAKSLRDRGIKIALPVRMMFSRPEPIDQIAK